MELFVVGFGPGGIDGMTKEAEHVIRECDVVAGYKVYVELLKQHFPQKEYYSSPMMKERERCEWAIRQALSGKRVAVVCSGDSGVYGMAGLLFEVREKLKQNNTEGIEQLEFHVVPGVTAACSGAALLGAPLTHDFSVISLSDLMTPISLIRDRIRHAAISDMVICLYNPASKKRQDYLRMACDIILAYRSGQTVCGCVRNIGREGEHAIVLSLEELREYQADMFTTVFVGNSTTRNLSGKMVTPRGYRDV